MTQESFFKLAEKEASRARAKHPPFHSAHEAYGVMLEEVDEFWKEVKKKPKKRKPEHMLQELVQIAAMCHCAAYELGLLKD